MKKIAYFLMKQVVIKSMAIAVVIFVCNGCQDQFEYKAEPLPVGKFDMTIYEFLDSRSEFDSLVKAIDYAGLKDMLNSTTETYTFFAPPNDRWLVGTALLTPTKPINFYTVDAWRNTILRHTSATRIFSPDQFEIEAFQYTFSSVNGQLWGMRRNASNVLVGEKPPGSPANVLGLFGVIRTSNIEVTNGVIHIPSSVGGLITI